MADGEQNNSDKTGSVAGNACKGWSMSEDYEPGLVSVIIPTCNRAQLLTQAIDSVLSQTYKNFEIIVVDDGSTDDTKRALVQYMNRIRYMYQENQGGAAARNVALKLAKGEYIAFLDSDDLWFPQKLERQVEILDKYGEFALVYTNIIYINNAGKFSATGYSSKMFKSGYLFKETLLRKVACGHPPTWLIRKSCLDETGGFDPEFRTSHDRDMIVRIARKYKIYGIRDPLAMVRQHHFERLRGSSSAEQIERYWFKFLDKLFTETDEELITEKLKKQLIAGYYFLAGKQFLKANDLHSARNRFWLAIVNRPFQLKAYMYFLATLTGNKGFEILNKIRRLLVGVSNSFHRLRYVREYD
ncbi:MAG: glycosyltransferase family A protein [Planctomycetota bacterium]